MTLREIVIASMSDTFRVLDLADGVQVTTHCLYPSNAFVDVVVRGGRDTFTVTDDGRALREIEAAGAEVPRADRLIRHLVEPRGLHVYSGVITSPYCSLAALPLAITMVSNTSREVAEWLFSHMRIKRPRDFKTLLKQFLENTYLDRVRHETLIGHSNKPYKFEHLIQVSESKRIVVDPVINDANSINSRVVANMDVRAADHPGLEQRIVYDDTEDWKPEDLSLLQVGATVVRFSKMPEVLQRLTH